MKKRPRLAEQRNITGQVPNCFCTACRTQLAKGIRWPVKVRRPLAVLTNGTVGPNAKCCAGLCKASSPARHAPCQSPIALQSLVPNPSDPKPSSPVTRSPQQLRTSGCGQACRRIAKCARCDRLPRLILPWRQPYVRADRPRSGKSSWVLNRNHIGQHGDYPDAGHAHQKSARRVVLCQRAHGFIGYRNLFAQLSPRRKHWSNDRRHVIMIGEQSLDPSIERTPRMAPGSIPNVLSTPRIWFDRRVVMPTSCALAPSRARVRCASSDFTSTDRYHPVRMICASPSASF